MVFPDLSQQAVVLRLSFCLGSGRSARRRCSLIVEDVAQSITEFVSHLRYCVILGIRGSSRRVAKKWSNAPLKVGRLQFVRLRTLGERQLKRRGPLWGREANLMDLILGGAVEGMGGGIHERPLLSLWVTLIGVQSKFGI